MRYGLFANNSHLAFSPPCYSPGSFGRPFAMSQDLPASIPAALFYERADAIADAARELAQHGWTPATSSNFSMRVDTDHAAITISGRDKGKLGRDDIML